MAEPRISDPAKFTEELTSKLRDYKLPGVDVDAVVASQRKNVEALANASRAAFEGTLAVAKRQGEILQETMNQTAKAFDALAETGPPPEVAAKQAELAKEAFEKALGNMRELAEMVTKAQQGAIDTMSGRISQSLDELAQMALKMKEPSATERHLPVTSIDYKLLQASAALASNPARYMELLEHNRRFQEEGPPRDSMTVKELFS